MDKDKVNCIAMWSEGTLTFVSRCENGIFKTFGYFDEGKAKDLFDKWISEIGRKEINAGY